MNLTKGKWGNRKESEKIKDIISVAMVVSILGIATLPKLANLWLILSYSGLVYYLLIMVVEQ